jgi:hypothetical protein
MEEKRILPVKQIISGIKSGRTDDDEIMLKYNLTTKDLQILFDKLLVAGLVTKNELEQRSFSFADTFELDLENDNPVNDGRSLSESTSDAHREDDHVNNSWECPACGKIQATRFDECPKCGVIVHKYLEKQARERKRTESISSESQTPQTEQGNTVLDSIRVQSNDPKIAVASDIWQIVSRTFIRLRAWIIDVNSLRGATRLGKITKVAIVCFGLLILVGFLSMLGKQSTSPKPERVETPQSQPKKFETSQAPKQSSNSTSYKCPVKYTTKDTVMFRTGALTPWKDQTQGQELVRRYNVETGGNHSWVSNEKLLEIFMSKGMAIIVPKGTPCLILKIKGNVAAVAIANRDELWYYPID